MDKQIKKLIRNIIALIIALIGVVLCFVWYDWKLAVIIALILWGNNLTED